MGGIKKKKGSTKHAANTPRNPIKKQVFTISDPKNVSNIEYGVLGLGDEVVHLEQISFLIREDGLQLLMEHPVVKDRSLIYWHLHYLTFD